MKPMLSRRGKPIFLTTWVSRYITNPFPGDWKSGYGKNSRNCAKSANKAIVAVGAGNMATHNKEQSAILLVHCDDQPGLVASVTRFIQQYKGNILDLDQHTARED